MNKVAVGVDIIEIERIQRAAAEYRNAFLKRIYTRAELDSSLSRPDGLAARFAAKEAVMKTLGTGVGGVRWQDIEILTNADGAPYIKLYGRASDKAKELGLSTFSLSLSHCKTFAIAMVVGYAA
jgi:holo-[acyl-carrier protein] synthase